MDEVVGSAAEAVAGIGDGASLAVGGFGPCGVPTVLTFERGSRDLRVVANTSGLGGKGFGKSCSPRAASPARWTPTWARTRSSRAGTSAAASTSRGSARGDLANRSAPGKTIKAVGLVHGARRVVVVMGHTAWDGSPMSVGECSLPRTGKGCVEPVITGLDVTDEGLVLVGTAPGAITEEIRAATEPERLERAAAEGKTA
ncbi:CoA-transferase [Actinomadura fibrosa]|uniref:CoA-transferase n=1 Tax=Actinomadura fibrosa TaxID=111802 RepID=A0ABW2XX26_9ACTN|nr:CoA-transferase [Actinomadura fibrosa]